MSLFNSNLTAAANQVLAAAPIAPLAAVLPSVLGDDDILAASKALTATAHINGMVRPFLPHQAAAYLYSVDAIKRWGGTLLGHDMGLGKTQVLFALVADAIEAGGYAIMEAPPVAKGGYMSDLAASFPHLRFAHLNGRKPERDDEGNPIVPDADIYFISDDALTLKAWLVESAPAKELPILNAFAKGARIFTRDEIHRDKGTAGKPTARAKVAMAMGNAMRASGGTVVGATGTLLTNRPVEAFIPLQVIGGENLVLALTPGARKISGFLFRYCNPTRSRFGYDFNGVTPGRELELHDNLRRTTYSRIEKSDLGNALPHGGWIVTPIALNGTMDRYEALSRDFLATVRAEKGPEAMWRAQSAEALTRMMALWGEAGAAKAKAAVEYVLDLVDQGRKVVVFYEHSGALAGLTAGFTDAKVPYSTINGAVTGDRRIREIEAFQTGPNMVLLAQTSAAGMAITLTAAADAVYVQLPWSAGSLKQSADRILRADDISRARALAGEAVTWHVLVARHNDGRPTIDDHMWQVLEAKAQVVDAVNAGKPITLPDANIHHAILQAWFDAEAAA